MKYIFLLLVLALFRPCFAQKTEEIYSRKLNEDRQVTIVTPPYYDAESKQKYPLIVLLDGNYLTDPFMGIMDYTASWDDLPQSIIVGIHQTKEQREDDTQTDEKGIPINRGDLFYEFISSELLPFMEKNYNIAPFKIIAGHGATAGYINFFLYKDEPLFSGYICLSPELPANMEVRLPEMITNAKKPIYYYLATAEGDIKRFKEAIQMLDTNLQTVKNENFHYHFDEFKGATHYSLVALGIAPALYGIFPAYQPISTMEYQEKIAPLTTGQTAYLKNKYDLIEKQLGVKMPVRLNDFKAIEASIMKNWSYDEFKELSDIAKDSYPKTVIGEYYEALYYEMTGNLRKAKKIYLNSFNFEDIGDYTKDYMIKKAETINVN